MFHDNDPFAGGEKTPSLSFDKKPIGTSYTGKVTKLPEMVQSRDYLSGDPVFWKTTGKGKTTMDTGQPVMSAVTVLNVDGEERSLWAQKPSAMWAAISSAQRELGRSMRIGDTLTVTFTGEKPHPDNPQLNAIKIYEVKITGADPFGEAPAAEAPKPAATPAPANAPAPSGDASKVTQLRALGKTDEEIAKLLSLDPIVVSLI